jgi:hypothetical protein
MKRTPAKNETFKSSDFRALDCGKPEGPVFLTAEAKARTCALFVRFVRAGFPETIWRGHRALYDCLNSMYGFIAHFNSAGFYAAKFGTRERRLETLEFMRDYRGFYGDPRYTSSDMERALSGWIKENPSLIYSLVNEIRADAEAFDRESLARLKAKYETKSKTRAICGDCEKVYEVIELKEISNIWERVETGAEMPAGECPDCGALAYLDCLTPAEAAEAKRAAELLEAAKESGLIK